jgi:hypothetical protein
MVQTNEIVVWLLKCSLSDHEQGATDAQQATHKEEKKKDFKVLFFIHQCVDGDKFEKVGDCKSSKQVWEPWRRHTQGLRR